MRALSLLGGPKRLLASVSGRAPLSQDDQLHESPGTIPGELLSSFQSSPCAGLAQPAAKMGRELIWVGVCFSSQSLDVQQMCCLHE